MYGVMKAMVAPREIPAYAPHPGFARITEYDCTAGGQTANSFDWFHAPASSGREGLGAYLVRTQSAGGGWSGSDDCGPNSVYSAFATGWRILTLSSGVTQPPPDAEICDCDEQEYNLNQDIHLDGSCSTHPDSSRTIVRWEWDLDCDGEYDDASGPQATIPGGFPAEGHYCVGLRVIDDNPAGERTDVTACEVWVHPPPHCPHGDAGGPYEASPGQVVTLDASASWDPDNTIASYEWDLDNDGQCDDCTGVQCQHVWPAPFTGTVCVCVTDAAGRYPACTDRECTTVEIGCHPPVAEAGGPYETCMGCTVTLDATGSSDVDPGDTVTCAWDLDNDGEFDDAAGCTYLWAPPGPVGTVHTIKVRVTDTCPGVSDTDPTTVKIVPNLPPDARCRSVHRSANGSCQGHALATDFDDGSSDPDGDPITFAVDPAGPYPLGPTPVILTVTDSHHAADTCTTSITVADDTDPTVTITPPPGGSCHAGPVTILHVAGDNCDQTLDVSYSPPGGPTYRATGDYHVVLTVRDDAGNEAMDDIDFTIDTTAPEVVLLEPTYDQLGLPPVDIPIDIRLRSRDDDGASGGIAREVIKLSGCVIYDGLTYGDRDGLLSDELIQLNKYKLCQFMTACRFQILSWPTIRVEATDACGGNTNGAQRIIRLRLLKTEVCTR